MTTTQTRWITSTNPDAPPDRLRDYQHEQVRLDRAARALRLAARVPGAPDATTSQRAAAVASALRHLTGGAR